MGEVYSEFEETLQAWRRRHAGQPRREMQQLFLLALEREQLVSVGYRETLIAERLRALDIPNDVRALARHALLWAWKDEEMHATYIRGVLLRIGDPLLRARAFVQQLAGAVAGWASSVRQHVPWRRAPLSNLVAVAVTVTGLVLGKVPRHVRDQLAYGSFRGFCLFNVDAERTASRCWERLTELAAADGALPPEMAGEFARMRLDEDRHAIVFQALADVLDEGDRLRPGESAASLHARLAPAGEFFLPCERRASWTPGAPGSGGAVHVVAGGPAEGKRDAFERLLEQCDAASLLTGRAAELGKAVTELVVAIKPTFMIGYHRKDLAPVTDPVLVDALAAWLRDQGVGDVAVIDAPTIYDRFYGRRSVAEVAAYLGFTSRHYRLVDASAEQVPHAYVRGMAQHTVARSWKEADLRISFAKMRTNAVDMATLTVANLEGLGPRHDTFFFAERQAQRDTVIMMLLGEFPPHLSLLDAFDSASDGILGMMGNPRPKVPCRLYAARDPIALDVVALRHMGLDDPDRCNTLRSARQWFSDPRPRLHVVGPDEPIAGIRGPWSTEHGTLLSLLAYPVYQFGSGRGALFVPEMDEEAFPPSPPPGPMLRAGRRAVQAAFGLRHPR